MGEIDTKSIKSVQTALTLFEENCEQRKKLLGGKDLQKDMEGLLNDLATYKLQLETNDSIHQQSLLNLEKTIDKLEADNDKYIAKYRQAMIQNGHLESQIIQLSQALIALETAKENAILIEKQVSDLNESLLIAQKNNLFQKSRIEALEKENHEQRVELENANQRVNQLICEKMLLESELDGFSEKESEADAKQKINLYQESRIEALEKENHEQTVELENANQRVNQLICEKMSLESELDGFSEKENEAEAKQKINLYQESRIEALEKENHELTIELENANQQVNQLMCEKMLLESELDGFSENVSEVEASKARADEDKIVKMKKELEMAMGKAGELRSRAEQAASRAEAAMEGQLRRWREQKQKKKAALAELREDCVPKKYESPTTHQPLSKILNMKF